MPEGVKKNEESPERGEKECVFYRKCHVDLSELIKGDREH